MPKIRPNDEKPLEKSAERQHPFSTKDYVETKPKSFLENRVKYQS